MLPRLRVEPTPVVAFGGLRDDPRQEFVGSVQDIDAHRLRDGRWIVMDRFDLKVYSPSGAFEGTLGRRGRGPGEFGHILGLCVLGDGRLQVLDRGLRRIVRFSREGRHLETRAVSGAVEFRGCFSDGSTLARESPTELYAALDRNEPVTGTVFRTMFKRVRDDGQSLSTFEALPFESFTVLRRRISAVVRRDTMYFAESYSPEVRIYGPDGRLVRRVAWEPSAVRPVTEALVRAQQSGRGVSAVGGDQIRSAAIDMGAEPRTVPPLGDLLVGNDGTLWVSSYPLRDEATVWRAFHGDGRPLGELHMPSVPGFTNLALLQASAELAIFRAVDDDGAVHVLVHRIVQGGEEQGRRRERW